MEETEGGVTMNRIHELRKAQKISQAKLAHILNVHQTTVSSWEIGTKSPDNDMLKKLADLFGVTMEYMLGYSEKPQRTNWIPVYGKVAAGIPVTAVDEVVDQEELTDDMVKDGSEYIGIRVAGQSMEPKISEGDTVIVRIQPDVEDGEIAVVLVNGDEATCKKIKKIPDGIMLLSLNPAYQPIFYTNKEVETLPVRIIGKVVELRAKF
jgi:repressor LexA